MCSSQGHHEHERCVEIRTATQGTAVHSYPPSSPHPTSKLGCLGGSAGGSEGLANPRAASVHGPGHGLRGTTAASAEPGRSYFGRELLPGGGVTSRLHGWRQRSLTVPRDPSGSCQLGWKPQSHSATLPEPRSQKNPSVPSHGETSEVSGVLPLAYN